MWGCSRCAAQELKTAKFDDKKLDLVLSEVTEKKTSSLGKGSLNLADCSAHGQTKVSALLFVVVKSSGGSSCALCYLRNVIVVQFLLSYYLALLPRLCDT